MKEKKRILIIENSVHITGALKSVCRTAYDLKDYFEFIFVLPSGSKGRSWIEGKGFTRIYELPFLEISKRWKPFFLYFPRLLQNSMRVKQIAIKEKADLIHVNDFYNLVMPVARFLGAPQPYICHTRFLPEKFPKLLFKSWLNLHLRHAKRIIAVSKYLYNQLPVNPKISVIYNELPVEERYPGGLNKLASPTILYLSNVINGKGHQFAIEAFSRVHHAHPEWRLRFVGGDMGLKKNKMFLEHLKALTIERGIEGKTDWIDFTEDVEREYRQAHLVLNFSESESFSITCLEALYFGCPIIATASGGPAEIIDHHVTGFLVPKADVSAMVHFLKAMIEDEKLRERFSVEGMKIVRERFNVLNTSFKLKTVYDETLKEISE